MAKMLKIRITDVTQGDESSVVNGIGRPNEEIVERPLVQQSGFSSIPRAGSIGIALQEGENIKIIGTTDIDTKRPALGSGGDVSVHNDADRYIVIIGNYIKLKYYDSIITLDGNVTLESPSNTITLKANGDIEIGNTALKKLITEDILSVLTAHTHAGVTVGGGVTSAATFAPPLSTALHATLKTKAQ